MASIAEALDLAYQHASAGRRAEAARLCVRILEAAPDEAEAAHLLGVLHAQAGRPGRAAGFLGWAAALLPAAAPFLSNLANALHALDRPADAEAAYRRALRLAPGFTDAHANRARSLRALGRPAEAAAGCRTALALEPAHADALINLADALLALGQPLAAADTAARAAALTPGRSQAELALGAAAAKLGRLDAAEASLRRALAADDGLADAWANLGAVLAKQGRGAEALDAFARTEAIRPDATLWSLRAAALVALGRPRDALADLDRALAASPHDAGLMWNRAFALLLAGDAAGWSAFEARRADANAEPPWRSFAQPAWRGEDAAGRTLLLYAEQGLGDTLQFLRLVPVVAGLGARVVLEVQRPLLGLAQGLGAARVIARGDPLPPFDLECPLMSVPHVLGLPAAVPMAAPYLAADPERVVRWRERIGGNGPKVGLVWAGNPRFPADALRSPRLTGLAPVLRVPGVRLFGLQMGPGREDLDRVKLPPGFTDLGREIAGFADTAAIMANLDLVISSCTAPAHLAGALGVPVWLVLPAAPDWRWGLGRADTPWYPSARLFRQDRPGDWHGVAGRVAAALDALAATHS